MSVTQVQEKNGLLGGLGMLATVAGAATGQPWLSALGTGLSTMNGAMNGGNSGQSGSGSLQEILENLGKTIGGWFKPTDGNIAKVKPETDMTPLNYAREILSGSGTGGSSSKAANPYAGIGEAIFNVANQVGNSGDGTGDDIWTKANQAGIIGSPVIDARNKAMKILQSSMYGGF